MNIKLKATFAVLAAASIFSACQTTPYEGYDATENGLYYKFYNQTEEGKKPEIGEHVMINYQIKITETDSVLVNSKNVSRTGTGEVEMPLRESTFKGSLEEGLMMMTVGDSASFILPADSFFTKSNGRQELPPFVKPGNHVTVDIKLTGIKDKATVEKERQEMMAAQEQQMQEIQKLIEERKAKEPEEIKTYIKENKITAKPTESGLYFIEQKRGTGEQIKMGDLVTVDYTLFLLDGTQIEKDTMTFQMQPGGMIPGWLEGISMMRNGGKARLLMPSSIAYGEMGNPAIEPHTPLLFEVEIKDVKPAQ